MPRTVLAALVSLGILTGLAVPSRAPAQEAAELAALCVEAYGGEEAIAAASAFMQIGEIVSPALGGGTGRILRAFHRPDKLRVEVAYPDRDVELRVLVGSRGWRGGQPVSGPMHLAMVLEVAAGLTVAAEIDPETGRVHRTSAHIPLEGAPRPLVFINEYSDFREVNGVLFAFRETTYAQGRHTADITLEEVKTFDVLPAEHFDPDPSKSSS